MPSKVTFSDGSTLNGTTTTKDYCANVVYENGVQKLLLTEEGYVDLFASTHQVGYKKPTITIRSVASLLQPAMYSRTSTMARNLIPRRA